MEHIMNDEKLEQNAGRLSSFLFHTLGCNKTEAKIIIFLFIKNYLDKNPKTDKGNMEEVVRWAEFVKNNPREKWKPIVNESVNSYFKEMDESYKNIVKVKKEKDEK